MQHPHAIANVTVTRNNVSVVLTISKYPVRGLTREEWLERECLNVFGTDEMKWCGSRWRTRITQCPDRMERVLADVRVQQKEGKAIRNAGAYAEDLYRRFA